MPVERGGSGGEAGETTNSRRSWWGDRVGQSAGRGRSHPRSVALLGGKVKDERARLSGVALIGMTDVAELSDLLDRLKPGSDKRQSVGLIPT